MNASSHEESNSTSSIPLLMHFQEHPTVDSVRMYQTAAGATHHQTMGTATRPTYHPTGPNNDPDSETDIYDDSHDDPETDYHEDQ